MTGAWQWQQLAWHQVMAPQVVVAALERLATAPELGQVVLELRANQGRARWLVGSAASRASDLALLLGGQLPAGLHQPVLRRRAVDWAVRLQAPRRAVACLPERVADTVRALYTAMSDVAAGSELVLQLVVGRRLGPAAFAGSARPLWQQLLVGQDELGSAPGAGAHQAEQHGAAVCLRLGLADQAPGARSAAGRGRAHRCFAQLLGALRIAETSAGRLRLVRESPAALDEARRPRWWPMRLQSGQLAALCGWPVGQAPLPLLGGLHPRLVAPPRLASGRRLVGVSSAPGSACPVAIPLSDAVYHTHLLGPTGTGKSTVLLSLALADAAEGRGMLLLDPKGDLVTDLLERVPAERHQDVVVIDPTSLRPVGVNPLAGPLPQAPLRAEAVLDVMAELFAANWGIRTADALGAALLTLARIPQANLLWLPPLLTDPAFRARALAQAPQDPLGADAFWAAYDAKRPQTQAVEIAPVLNKLRQLFIRPGLRAVLGQAEPRFDLRQLLTHRRIVLVNLNHGRLGAGAARLLGSLLLSQVWHHLLERQRLPETQRPVVSIYIDEVHQFLAGLPGDLSEALALSRSLGAAFHLAHQYRAQLTPQMLGAIDSNTRNKIYFRQIGNDALAAARLAPGLEPADFQLLGPYQAYAQLMQHGIPTDWFSIRTQPAGPSLGPAADLYAASQDRYGLPADQTEQQLVNLTRTSVQHTDAQADPGPWAEAPIGRKSTHSGPAADHPPDTSADRSPALKPPASRA